MTKIVNDEIILENRDRMLKLALSHGLAQSIKLSSFEESFENIIEETKRFPEVKKLLLKILIIIYVGIIFNRKN